MADGNCSRCGKILDGKHHAYCKSCMAEYARNRRHANPAKARSDLRNWQRANPEKMVEYKRRWTLRKYGLTEELEVILERQDGKCPICLDVLDIESGKWGVDHNHDTGLGRDILCTNCNAMLGHARDSQFILSQAITYLRRHTLRKVL